MRKRLRSAIPLALALLLFLTTQSNAVFLFDEPGLELRREGQRLPEILPDPLTTAPGDDDMPNRGGSVRPEHPLPIATSASSEQLGPRSAISWVRGRIWGMRLLLIERLKALR